MLRTCAGGVKAPGDDCAPGHPVQSPPATGESRDRRQPQPGRGPRAKTRATGWSPWLRAAWRRRSGPATALNW